jgi:hypothetical protein
MTKSRQVRRQQPLALFLMQQCCNVAAAAAAAAACGTCDIRTAYAAFKGQD